jgi:hypothetical protein
MAALALLTLLASPGFVAASSPAAQPKAVPTTICASTPASPVPTAYPRFRGHGGASSGAYDEQLGLTFTQSFSALEYNVTAVVQTDPNLGTGPGYLLNGLADTGYWYQVGVSWNWSPGQTPGSGFDMNYEVFDASQNSIFPTGGGGGVQSFSGTVNPGDTVLLNLYFANSSVIMSARDVNTGASASESYSAFGGVCFVGTPASPSNSNGYFTGLMTEWYHGAPFFANGKQVTYTDPLYGISSAWMWMDEFNSNTMQSVFTSTSPAPVVFSNPTALQEFSFNGTTEYANAYEFITGNSTGTASVPVELTLSYSIVGGGSGESPPVLTYVSGGTRMNATLGAAPVTYSVDAGSTWSVTPTLGGSSSTERWQTGEPTTGVASTPQTFSLAYNHQFLVDFAYTVSGGGSGYAPPTVTYSSFGSAQSTSIVGDASPDVWADSGTPYSFKDPLSGSTVGERWQSADAAGTVSASGPITASYYHQFLATLDASFTGSQIFPSVALTSTSAGSPITATIVQGGNTVWLDAGASYSVPQSISLAPGERWVTNSTTSGTLSGQLALKLDYRYEYYVQAAASDSNGGTISGQSGWYLPGTSLAFTATPGPGWKFVGWSGSGVNSSASTSVSLTVSAPANLTAIFYPGVTVTASGSASVSYRDGSVSGSVGAGTSSVVYVPIRSNLTLVASSSPLLYSFGGWSGASASTDPTITLLVTGPESVTATSSFNLLVIGGVLLLAILIALGLVYALVRSRRRGEPQKETVGSPAA